MLLQLRRASGGKSFRSGIPWPYKGANLLCSAHCKAEDIDSIKDIRPGGPHDIRLRNDCSRALPMPHGGYTNHNFRSQTYPGCANPPNIRPSDHARHNNAHAIQPCLSTRQLQFTSRSVEYVRAHVLSFRATNTGLQTAKQIIDFPRGTVITHQKTGSKYSLTMGLGDTRYFVLLCQHCRTGTSLMYVLPSDPSALCSERSAGLSRRPMIFH